MQCRPTRSYLLTNGKSQLTAAAPTNNSSCSRRARACAGLATRALSTYCRVSGAAGATASVAPRDPAATGRASDRYPSARAACGCSTHHRCVAARLPDTSRRSRTACGHGRTARGSRGPLRVAPAVDGQIGPAGAACDASESVVRRSVRRARDGLRFGDGREARPLRLRGSCVVRCVLCRRYRWGRGRHAALEA